MWGSEVMWRERHRVVGEVRGTRGVWGWKYFILRA